MKPVIFSSVLDQTIKRLTRARRHGKSSDVTTGLIGLDEALGGLRPSELVVIAGPVSSGKTALATKIAVSAAKSSMNDRDCRARKAQSRDRSTAEKKSVLYFPFDVSAETLVGRILSAEAEIPTMILERGAMGAEKFALLKKVSRQLKRLPLLIDDTAGQSIAAVRERSRFMKRKHGLSLIVIDHLELLTVPPQNASLGQHSEISAIARDLKALARELDVPIMIICQLPSASEALEDKRPHLANLCAFGTLERHADTILFVFREEFYHSRAEPMRQLGESDRKFAERHQTWMQRGDQIHNMAEVVIAKQRRGPIGTLPLKFIGEFVRFDDCDFAEWPEPLNSPGCG
jgi:replicative DNA helicase